MDRHAYPEDLLKGVFPLVFAVNAIYRKDDDCDTVALSGTGSSKRSSLFDLFLDAIASSLMDSGTTSTSSGEPVDGGGAPSSAMADTLNFPDKTPSRPRISLFKTGNVTDEEESSDDDDGLADYFGGTMTGRRRSAASGFGFGRRATPAVADPDSTNPTTSYAKALKQGQSFFQHARIVSVSQKYGFPPSKDPDGTRNLPFEMHQILKQPRPRGSHSISEREASIARLFQQYPMSGILPAGWLEKHVHALPSAILVICTVTAVQKEQGAQDRHLFETIEHLMYSLVPKRQCSIQIVGLMKDEVSEQQGEEWSQAILRDVTMEDANANTSFTVTLLQSSKDLQCRSSSICSGADALDRPSYNHSEALRRLHRTARDASLLYYLRQARRTKDKLVRLLTDQDKRRKAPPPVQVSPLLVRYCFKIAIFYEFQMKHEKSLRFLAEAYRHVSKYYEWLLARKNSKPNSTSSSISTAAMVVSEDEMNHRPTLSPQVNDISDSVEVELSNGSGDNGGDIAMWSRVVPDPPEDILFQCRAVADWLNMKLLSSGFASHTEGGLLAAANQWRLHCQVFATRRHAAKLKMEDWVEWSYIARQRLVMSQLVEKHPPTALGTALGNEFDEVILRCSPWRTYEAAAEAMLRLGRGIDMARTSGEYMGVDRDYSHNKSERSDISRARFVGGRMADSLALEFQEEKAVNHREKALKLILLAISLFERELEKEKRGFYAEDEFSERSSSRTGSRLYYLAGGILLGMERHQEAVDHLTKASRYSRGWRELELAVRRMLIECYEKHIPSETEASVSSETLASMILDSYFNAEMSSHDLRRALDHFAAMSDGDRLKWYHEMQDEEDLAVPFSFAVTFPGQTHATSGDTVEASVVIKSNLDYAIHVNAASLSTLAGQLPIPTNDLLSATNASEGTEGGIIIQAKTAITVSTKLELPKDLSAISSDESGNGGELLGVAGKGSFAKNAKPRSAGLTSAGGARLVSEDELQPGNRNSQGWNVRFLGGKPLLCDGLSIVFYPVQAEKSSGGTEQVTLIELTIAKKKNRTVANIKRTPFEEENYIASAWSRPPIVPLAKGPRSLRVLGPLPQLVVTDMTEPLTKGKALEGTVNRILLKLQAGPDEICSNMKMTVSCFSVLITPSGSVKRLIAPEEITEEVENSIDMKNPSFRTPVLVAASKDFIKSTSTEYGYSLPGGWHVSGSGQKDVTKDLEPLKGGEASYVNIDFFRPAAHMQREGFSIEGAILEEDLGDVCTCKTDFYITISYVQMRPSAIKPPMKIRRRSARKRPVMPSSSHDDSGGMTEDAMMSTADQGASGATSETSKEVSLEFTGSLVWAAPLTATFSPGAKSLYPSGNRHPSNGAEGYEFDNDERVVVDGESVSTRCSLHLDPSMDGLRTELASIRFEDIAVAPESPVAVSLTTKRDGNETGLLYKSTPDDSCRILSTKSRFGVAFTVTARLGEEYRRGGISSFLGNILVDWRPSVLELPAGCEALATFDDLTAHGPLALDTPSTIRFRGPACYVERAPFEVQAVAIPSLLKAAMPFDIKYIVTNTTTLHQSMNVRLGGSSDLFEGSVAKFGGLLLSGFTQGQITLGPLERQMIGFTVISCRPGEVALPALQISSSRYQRWVINDGDGATRKRVYVMP